MNTTIVLLGTGNPKPDPRRMGPSLAIVCNEKAYVVDFGPGIVRRCQQAFEAGIEALAPRNLERAFLTHLHSDHTIGYPDLMFTPWIAGRKRKLETHGPEGLAAMTRHIELAYAKDREVRVCGLEPNNPEAYGTIAHEIATPEEHRLLPCYRDDHIEVEAFKVNHGEGWTALGYRFVTADRTIVVSGDTAPHAPLIDLWAGCDVLVHEVYSATGFAARSAGWQKYHAHMHTSSTQLAEIARQVRPKLLLLTHVLLWGATEDDLLQEIRSGYDGEVICGEDLGQY